MRTEKVDDNLYGQQGRECIATELQRRVMPDIRQLRAVCRVINLRPKDLLPQEVISDVDELGRVRTLQPLPYGVEGYLYWRRVLWTEFRPRA